jgi:prepilin-type N-terminal cleavage/methylation domain-containing protein
MKTSSRMRGFSIVELLVALTISSTLMAATLVALDAMFKRYTVISDTASSHVVARVVMHRILTMVRTGTEFGPYPTDVLDASQNPLTSTSIQFVSFDNGTTREITTIDRRASGTWNDGTTNIEHRGPYTLWLKTQRTTAGSTTTVDRPLLDGILDAKFNLEYDPGPRLRRATIDLTVQPQGNVYSKFDSGTGKWSVQEWDNSTGRWVERKMSSVAEQSPTIRLIASTSPRTDQ